MPNFDLTGRVALVTGGNGGIGLGMARGLAEAGADIAIVARDEAKSAAAVAQVEALGCRAVAISCDVGDLDAIRRAVASTVDQLGRLDILVNNAGTTDGLTTPLEVADELWDRVFEINLKAALHFAQVAHPALVDSGRGSIINVASTAARRGKPYTPAYSSSKAALVSLTESLADAFAGDGIRVNSVLPGIVETEMVRSIPDSATVYQAILARTPMGRMGRPDEFGGVAVFLASDASSFMTGESIVMAGGLW